MLCGTWKEKNHTWLNQSNEIVESIVYCLKGHDMGWTAYARYIDHYCDESQATEVYKKNK